MSENDNNLQTGVSDTLKLRNTNTATLKRISAQGSAAPASSIARKTIKLKPLAPRSSVVNSAGSSSAAATSTPTIKLTSIQPAQNTPPPASVNLNSAAPAAEAESADNPSSGNLDQTRTVAIPRFHSKGMIPVVPPSSTPTVQETPSSSGTGIDAQAIKTQSAIDAAKSQSGLQIPKPAIKIRPSNTPKVTQSSPTIRLTPKTESAVSPLPPSVPVPVSAPKSPETSSNETATMKIPRKNIMKSIIPPGAAAGPSAESPVPASVQPSAPTQAQEKPAVSQPSTPVPPKPSLLKPVITAVKPITPSQDMQPSLHKQGDIATANLGDTSVEETEQTIGLDTAAAAELRESKEPEKAFKITPPKPNAGTDGETQDNKEEEAVDEHAIDDFLSDAQKRCEPGLIFSIVAILALLILGYTVFGLASQYFNLWHSQNIPAAGYPQIKK